MRILVFEPFNPSYIKEIKHDLDEFQAIVGGYCEWVPTERNDILIICNEEGKLLNLPFDRGFYGTFFVVGLSESKETSLTDEQIISTKTALENRVNYASSNRFLTQYFQKKKLPEKSFLYTLNDTNYYISSSVIIQRILQETNELVLKTHERIIANLESKELDIYDYLKIVGSEIAQEPSIFNDN